eukprot:8453328-Pyramimonas_sp.AAC.1
MATHAACASRASHDHPCVAQVQSMAARRIPSSSMAKAATPPSARVWNDHAQLRGAAACTA